MELHERRGPSAIPKDLDPEILFDPIAGAAMHHLLVQQGEESKETLHAYLLKVFRHLGLVRQLFDENSI